MLLNRSSVLRRIKESKKRSSKDVYKTLDKRMEELLLLAIKVCGNNKTLKVEDVLTVQVNLLKQKKEEKE